MQPITDDLFVGRTIAAKYVIERQLGVGAMGAVYLARHTALDKAIALKVMHRHLMMDASFASRFASEAKAASRLDHPNSIRVFDYGEESDGTLYIAMEYVDGRDLFSVIEEGRLLPSATVIDILSQVLAALAVAHDMGVLHRDLKPENIMVLRGRTDDGTPTDVVKVCDFGIAKILAAEPTPEEQPQRVRKHSTAGTVIGTPAYLSPEQARGAVVDARSDLYSVGVILYVLLTGREPFCADTPLGVVLKHVTDDVTPPSQYAPDVDPRLAAICLKALRKDPAERFQDARSMRQALRDALQGAATMPPTERRLASRRPPALADTKLDLAPVTQSAPNVNITPPRRRGAIVAFVGAALAVGVLGAGVVVYIRTGRSAAASVAAHTQTSGAETTASATASQPPLVIPANSVVATPPPTGDVATHPLAPTAKASARPTPTTTATTKAKDPKAKDPPAHVADNPPAPEPPPPAPPPPVANAVAPDPPPATVATPPPAEPPFDPSAARVEIGQPTNTSGGLSATVVARTVRGASGQITACYRSALERAGRGIEGAGMLHIETDGAGVITDARVGGPLGASTGRCIAGALGGRTLSGVDTGTASADVPLVFKTR
jgi:serine/threonine-protein kinase